MNCGTQPKRSALLLLTLALAAPASAAEAQKLHYALSVDGQAIGFRDLTVSYLPGEYGEVRILESWTELSLPIAGKTFRYQQRLAGKGGSGGFASAIAENGVAREVQAVRGPEGWIVSVAEGQTAKVYNYGFDELDLTTLSLIDPGVNEQLQGKTQLRVLAAESGAVLTGPLKEVGASQIKVGGQQIPVTEYIWTLPEGEVKLDYGSTGHLVRYTMNVAGHKVIATLDAPPPERTWGAAIDGPLIGSGGSLGETEL